MSEPTITLSEESLGSDVDELVSKTVEDTLNGLPEEKAEDLVGAERYECTIEQKVCRVGRYDRGLQRARAR